MLNDELLEIALEALAKHKISIEDIKKGARSLDEVVTSDRYKDLEDKKELDKRIDDLLDTMTSRVQTEMSKIEIPKDGIDGKDGESIAGKDGLSIQGKPGKDGKTVVGKQGVPGKSVKGEPGRDGKTIKGDKGKAGAKGTSIVSIEAEKDSLIITLSDGEVKQVVMPKTKSDGKGGFGPATNRAQWLSKTRDVDIQNPQNDEVLTYSNGKWVNKEVVAEATGPGDAVALEKRVEIEAMFKVAQSTAYKELTHASGNITNVDIYTTSGKTTKLFSKIIGYNNGNITSVSITDNVNGGTLNKTLAYSGSDLANITSTYTA